MKSGGLFVRRYPQEAYDHLSEDGKLWVNRRFVEVGSVQRSDLDNERGRLVGLHADVAQQREHPGRAMFRVKRPKTMALAYEFEDDGDLVPSSLRRLASDLLVDAKAWRGSVAEAVQTKAEGGLVARIFRRNSGKEDGGGHP